jgi:hypothetical protein
MPDSQRVIWAIWPDLPIPFKLFFLVLSLVCIYSLVSVTLIAIRLRSLMRVPLIEHARYLSSLRARCAHLSQLLSAISYLFGLVFFMVLPTAHASITVGREPFWIALLRDCLVELSFVANVFAVLFVLHLAQWFVSSRVEKCVLAMNTR